MIVLYCFNLSTNLTLFIRWRAIVGKFRRIGRLGDVISFPWLKSGELEIDSVEEAFKAKLPSIKPALVCGSLGEVANDPSVGGGVYYGAFDVAYSGRTTSDSVNRQTVSLKFNSMHMEILKSLICSNFSGRL